MIDDNFSGGAAADCEANVDANVDAEEIRKFSELAARWWDLEGECKPLHDINPLRMGFIEARSQLGGKKALDVGCGGGILTEALAARGAHASGIDMSAAALEVAKLHALESDAAVHYRQITAEALAALQPAQWDVVCCLELLEHVPDAASVVAACAALVKPGGAVYFSTINRTPKSFLMAIIGAEYVLNLVPRGTHQYEKLIRPSELNRWCERAGLSVVAMTGLHYHPLRRTYSLGPGVDVNYLVHCVRA